MNVQLQCLILHSNLSCGDLLVANLRRSFHALCTIVLKSKLCVLLLQMDHIIENLKDVMNRFKPPVEPHRYSVEFIPVVQSDMSMEDIKKAITFDPR